MKHPNPQHLDILRDLDRQCQYANSLWHSLERHKRTLASKFGISKDALQEAGIHVEGAETNGGSHATR